MVGKGQPPFHRMPWWQEDRLEPLLHIGAVVERSLRMQFSLLSQRVVEWEDYTGQMRKERYTLVRYPYPAQSDRLDLTGTGKLFFAHL